MCKKQISGARFSKSSALKEISAHKKREKSKKNRKNEKTEKKKNEVNLYEPVKQGYGSGRSNQERR
jgi:hypothetical protein